MIEEHREVLSAVADRDPDAAERALRHHLQMVLGEIPRLRGRHPATSRTESASLSAGNTSAGLAEGSPDAADGMKRNTLRGIPGARTMIPRSGPGKARVAAVWSEARLMRRMDRGSCVYSMADGTSMSWN